MHFVIIFFKNVFDSFSYCGPIHMQENDDVFEVSPWLLLYSPYVYACFLLNLLSSRRGIQIYYSSWCSSTTMEYTLSCSQTFQTNYSEQVLQ